MKHYSSGMYVRLAFAVAAHLEPEILIVDEVLAVGDAAFQKKSLGERCKTWLSGGRTVLIVSHNMPMIRSLCPRIIVLSGGTVAYDGSVSDGIHRYLEVLGRLSGGSLKDRNDRRGNGRLRFNDAYVVGASGVKNVLHMGEEVGIALAFVANETIRTLDVSIHINDAWDQTILRLATRETAVPFNNVAGNGLIICIIPRLMLLSGRYSLLIAASVPPAYEHLDHISQAVTFEVLEDDIYGTGKVPTTEFFLRTANGDASRHPRLKRIRTLVYLVPLQVLRQHWVRFSRIEITDFHSTAGHRSLDLSGAQSS